MYLKILFVEDDPSLSHLVSDTLTNSGYNVRTVGDGKLVIDTYLFFKPDICILDIMLPSKDGYTLAMELKNLQPDLPIIFLSAKALTEDVVRGFKSGGNDYLKKPFNIEELLVRVEALLNRFGRKTPDLTAENSTDYLFGGCVLNTLDQILKCSTGEHSLSYKESSLLEMLILHKNEVLERQQALIKIWGTDNFYNTRSMDVYMTHLRKLLKDEPGIQILGLRGVGYKLICK